MGSWLPLSINAYNTVEAGKRREVVKHNEVNWAILRENGVLSIFKACCRS